MIDVAHESQSKVLDHSRSSSIKDNSDGPERRYSEKEDIDSLDLTGAAFVDYDITDEYPILGGGDATTKRSAPPGGLQKRKSFGGMFGSKKNGATGTVGVGLPAQERSKSGKYTIVDVSQSHAGYVESDGVLYAIDTSTYTPTTPTPSTPSSSSSSSSASAAASALSSSPISISSCRPLFYPSPSGGHCAVFWPESCFYMVFLVKINKSSKLHRLSSTDTIGSSRRGSGNKQRPRRASLQSITEYEEETDDAAKQVNNLGSEMSSGGPGDDESFVEVDKGRCLSFAWMGTGKTYAVLIPGLRTEINLARRSSLGAMFSRTEKEKETGLFTPPKMVFKIAPSSVTGGSSVDIQVNVNALGDTSNTSNSISRGVGTGTGGRYAPQPHELFGGLLLCISVGRSTTGGKDSKGGDKFGGQKAISKIEADAIAQQQIENRKEQLEKEKAGGGKKNKTAAASVEQVVAASAVSWEESVGGGSEHYRATQKSRFYVLNTVTSKNNSATSDATTPAIVSPSLQLQPVGPYMKGVRSVMWDVSSGLCAVLVGLTINIFRLEVTVQVQSAALDSSSGHQLGAAADIGLRSQKGVCGSNISMSILTSIDLQSHLTTPSSMAFSSTFPLMVTLSWRNGQLFALTNSELLLICTDFPYLKLHSNNASDGKQGTMGKPKMSAIDENGNNDEVKRSKCPVSNVFILASSAINSLHGSSPGTRPLNSNQDIRRVTSFDKIEKDDNNEDAHAPCGVLPLKSNTGWLDIVGVRKGNILISSRWSFTLITL